MTKSYNSTQQVIRSREETGLVTAPGSHDHTIALMQVTLEAFNDAFRALEQLQTIVVDDGEMWQALHAVDDAANNVTGSVSAAFDASGQRPMVYQLIGLANNLTESTNNVRTLLNSAVAEAQNGQNTAQQGAVVTEEIINYLVATGQQ